VSTQLNFLLNQGLRYIHGGNLDGAELILKQIIKVQPSHSEALRLLGVIAIQKNDYQLALHRLDGSLTSNRRNWIAYSNKGNVLLILGDAEGAIKAHKKAIEINPQYAEAYNNLGNALLSIYEFQQAIDNFRLALKFEPNNYDFKINLGNAYFSGNFYDEAINAYMQVLEIDPHNASAHFYLAQIYLLKMQFDFGWDEYEWRWLSKENSSKLLISSKELWHGQPFEGVLYIWAEQGIGDQILYASLFSELRNLPQKKIISVENKLIPIFERSFTDFKFIEKEATLPECQYDYHVPLSSLGRFFRKSKNDFIGAANNYLIANKEIARSPRGYKSLCEKKLCGISWKSSNKSLGAQKSIALMDLSEILKLENVEFVNLQYGDISTEVAHVNKALDIKIDSVQDVDLYEDMDGALGLIDACDIILTTSNSTAHLAGALGKEVLLLLPFSVGRFWYWHDIDGISLWYPSVRVFKQEQQGDWSKPIQAAKAYLENRFGI
jgi:tetratricopeptide (TPR) repeat protein